MQSPVVRVNTGSDGTSVLGVLLNPPLVGETELRMEHKFAWKVGLRAATHGGFGVVKGHHTVSK